MSRCVPVELSISFPKLQSLLVFEILDDRQITHLICVHLKLLLCDFLGGFWAFFFCFSCIKKAQNTP